jgi:hypothetical protein
MEVEVYTSWKQQLDLKLDQRVINFYEAEIGEEPKMLEVG